jgi:hypothetical protein
MNKLKRIYTNGCSFTYDNYIYHDLKGIAYGDILAQKYNVDYLNMGLPGSCNRRIIRTTLRDAIEFTNDTLVIIQLTILQRTEKFFTPGQSNQWKLDNKQSYQEYHESIKGDTREKLNQEYYNTHVKFFDERAEITNIAADLLMLTAFLKNKHIPYYVFSYQPLVSDSVTDQVYNDRLQVQLRKDNRVMNILSDSLVNQLGPGNWFYDVVSASNVYGHLNPAGHNRAAEILNQFITAQPVAQV